MEKQAEETFETPGVIDKYKEAGKIANDVVKEVIKNIKAGVNIVELTTMGDKLIADQLSKVYAKKKNMQKGIAFPTCISVNQICGHYSPLVSDANEQEKEQATLKEGDVCKIDLGVHIDGFIALLTHTHVCSSSPITGKNADVILAAYDGVQASLRLLRPGNTNTQVTEVITKINEQYKVNPVDGVLSHDLTKHNLDGNHSIVARETYEQKVDKHEFQVGEAWALNVIISSGEGKAKETELRTTVFKRAIEKQFQLKTKHGRQFYNELQQKYPTLCFSTRQFEDEITAKLGVSECAKHELLNPYPVLSEKAGTIVASFSVTALVMNGGTIAITGLPLDLTQYKPDNKIEDQSLLDLLAVSMDLKEQKKAKKAKAEGEEKK